MITLTNAIITAYCACSICCGNSANGITASGLKPIEGRTVAAPRSVPIGSRVRIQGYSSKFRVEDRTAKRFDGRWDIYFKKHKDAVRFGVQRRNVTIIWTGQP